MARRRRRKEEAPIKSDMTPMIDVTFQLLIFFMLTIEFKTLEGKLAAYLPKDVGPNPTKQEPVEDIDLHIELVQPGTTVLAKDHGIAWTEGAGDFALVGHEIRYRLGRTTFPGTAVGRSELASRLSELHRGAPDRKVVVHPGEVVHGDVVAVLDACLEAGIEALSFGGSKR